MGQDFYSCNHCGEAFGDYWDGYEMCECGKNYCSQECATENGFERYDEDFNADEWYEKYGDVESTCQFCRGENLTDAEILQWFLDAGSFTREDAVNMIKESREY